MPTILAIETSTDNCSVAIGDHKGIISSRSMHDRSSHSTKLPVFIEEILNESRLNIAEINAIAVSMGPGSFTGLRIGVSLAKGICFGTGKPLIGINTLESLVTGAHHLMDDESLLCSLIDAGNNEAYYSVYNKHFQQIIKPEIADFNMSVFCKLPDTKKMFFAGYKLDKWLSFLQNNPDVIILNHVYPDASNLVQPALTKYLKNEFDDIRFFEPLYLRDFKARDFSAKIKKVLYPHQK